LANKTSNIEFENLTCLSTINNTTATTTIEQEEDEDELIRQ